MPGGRCAVAQRVLAVAAVNRAGSVERGECSVQRLPAGEAALGSGHSRPAAERLLGSGI